MLKLRPFQVVLLGLFGFLAIGGVIAFSVYRPGGLGASTYGGSVEIWGTLDAVVINRMINSIAEEEERFGVVEYTGFDTRTFERELTNAVAEGRGPDAVILSHESILRERPKIQPISYELLPRRQFQDVYIDGSDIFMYEDGVYGVPFAVDPLMMYWNRNMFSTAGITAPPTTWEDMVNNIVPRLTKLTDRRDIISSAIAFGEYSNVNNAKDIMLMLLLQTGSTLVYPAERGFDVRLNNSDANTLSRPHGDAALDFYTQFANPSRTTYSWNRSHSDDLLEFLAEDLALYFGFGSEIQSIRDGNANLNFDVARVPQAGSEDIEKSYGSFYTMALLRSSDNLNGAYQVTLRLNDPETNRELTRNLGLAPVQRSLIADGSADPARQALLDSALISRGWYDPNPTESENVFRIMIEDVTSGRSRISGAVADAEERLGQLLR